MVVQQVQMLKKNYKKFSEKNMSLSDGKNIFSVAIKILQFDKKTPTFYNKQTMGNDFSVYKSRKAEKKTTR